MAQYCTNKATTAGDGRKQKKFNKREKSLLTKIKAEKYRFLKALRQTTKDADEAKALARNLQVLEAEELRLANVADMIQLKPSQSDALGSFFANAFGWKKVNPLNATNNYSVAGEIRSSLLAEKHVISSMLDDAGSVAAVNRLTSFNTRLKQLVKGYGIDPKLIPEITQGALEVGQIPKLNNALENAAAVEAFQNLRYHDWLDQMKGHGFSTDEITELRNLAADVSTAFDEMRVVAASVGYDIPTLQGLGYLPRIATRDFDMRLRDITKAEGGEDLARELRTGNKMSSSWDKMRKTHHYIPEVHGAFLEDLLGIDQDKMLELFKNPEEWRNFLYENLSASQLDTLVDSGVFKRLPMTGREVFDYMVKQYDLPYEHLNEMFKTDPAGLVESYANGLKTAVANHAMAKMVVKDGLAAGWAMTKGQLDALPKDVRSNFVALGSLGIERWFDEKEILAMGGVYVHRIAADQWKGVLNLSSSPVQMGTAAKVWHYLATNLSKTALLSANGLYLGHTLLSNLIQGIGAGLDIGKVIPAMWDIVRVEKFGLESLDDTKKIFKVDGQMLSKREMYRKYRLQIGDTIAPQTPGVKRAGIHWDATDPRNIGKALHYMWNYANVHGDPVTGTKRGAEYLASLAQHGMDEMFAPVAYGASMLDQMFKWATVQSVAVTPGIPKVGKYVYSWSNKTFDSFEDIRRHVDDYYFQYSDIGSVTKNIGTFIRPFASYAMLNPPAQLRNMMRHPEKYLAYHKLLQVWNENESEGDIPEGAFAEYDLNGNYPIVADYDKNTKEGFVIYPNSYDPLTDTFTFFRETGEAVARSAGLYVGTSKEQLDMAQGKNQGIGAFLQQQFNQSYFKKPLEALLGIDFETGMKVDEAKQQYNTYLGVPMPKQLEAFLSIFPPVEALNRWNPKDVFGRKEQRATPRLSTANSTGYPIPMTDGKVAGTEKPLVEAKPSIFGFSRDDADSSKLAAERGGNLVAAAQTIGIRVSVLDSAKGMGMTMYDMKDRQQELEKHINDEGEALKLKKKSGEDDTTEFKQREAQLLQNIETKYQVDVEVERIGLWMKKNHVPPSEMQQQLKDINIYSDGLPLVGASRRKEMLRKKLELKQKVTGQDMSQELEMLK